MKYFLIFFVVIFFFSSAVTGACEASFSVDVIDKQALKTELIDANHNPRQKYTGQKGYLEVADTYFKGNMKRAFDTISSMLSKDIFEKLGWQRFRGTTKKFRELKNQILDENGNLKAEYIGQEEGYPLFADTFYGGEKKENGNMFNAFSNVSAILSTKLFKDLGWQQFHGTTKEFRELKNQILDENGNLKTEYIDQEQGYLLFADTFYGGDMNRTFFNVSAVLSKKLFKDLRWKHFHGATKEFKELKNQILDEDGNLKAKYIGQEIGYPLFADTFYGEKKNENENGDMLKAFKNISAVLSTKLFKKLGWQAFHGTTKEFRELKNQILDEVGNLKAEYIGQEHGYPLFADTFYGGEKKEKGNMLKAFSNISAVLSTELFKKLGWQAFHGTTKEFRELKNQILDKDGNLKAEYIGQKQGYPLFADTFYSGNMRKAFSNVSAVLSKDIFQQLGWKIFKGNTNQYHTLVMYFGTHQFEDYRGVQGQRQIAELIFNSNSQTTYMNVSALREYLFMTEDAFKDLRESGWSRTLQ